MTTYTTNLKLTQPALNATGWGTTVNNGITALVDDAVAGLVSVDVAGGNVTLTTANGVTDQARNMFIRAYNASVARDIIVPALTKLYFVINDCTAAVTFKVSGQTGVAVPAGKATVLRCDGTDIVPAVTFLTPGVEISGSSSSDMLRITQTGSGNAFVVEDSTSPDSSPFVIDATGKLILGRDTSTTTRVGGTNFAAGFQSSGTSLFQPSTAQFVYESTGATSCAYSLFARSRDATLGSQTIVQDGDRLGALSFAGSDGTQFSEAARIVAEVDGAPGTDDMPGRLVFSTTPDGSATPTERMRISSAGNVGIGTSSPTEKLEVYGTSPYILINNTSETEAGIKFVDSADPTTQIAVISYNSNSAGSTPNILKLAVNTVDRLAISSSGTTTLSGSAASVLVLDRSSASNTAIELKNTSGSMFIGNSDGTTFAVDDDNNLSDAPRFTVTNEGATRVNANTASDALLITQAGAGPALRITGNSTSAIARLSSTGSGASTFDGSGAGVEITAVGMNTSSKYTPALKFGSTDTDFTTTNPKFGAAILAEAAQTYSSDTAGGMDLLFWTSPTDPGTGNGLVERMRIDSAGNVGIGTASPAVALDVSGAVRASTGVLFGTDTATANTLDDYEEGTWTPEVADATTGGNVASAGTFSGSYTKVGRLVTITCLAANIGTSGMTSGNDVYVRGLPFTAASFSNTQMFTGAMLLTWTAITTQTAANLIDNTAYVRISENVVGAGFDYVTVGELTSAASDIYFTITYEAA